MNEHAKEIVEKISENKKKKSIDVCDRIITWNMINRCEQCKSSVISNIENEETVNAVEDSGA